MRGHEVKLKSRLGLGKLTRKMFRLLRSDESFPATSVSQEKFTHEAVPVIINHNSQREFRSALVNAERQKAEALMECRKRQIY